LYQLRGPRGKHKVLVGGAGGKALLKQKGLEGFPLWVQSFSLDLKRRL
jgi:hypothetical protein